MIFYIYFVMTPNLLTKQKMENVWIFSGELDCDFAEEATFNDHGGVNHIGGDDSVGKQQEKRANIRPFQRRKYIPTHTRTTNWLRKRR